MGSEIIKVIGEGGAHLHSLESPLRTFKDGIHKHLYFIRDRLVMTELDGANWHTVDPSKNSVGPEAEPRHKHIVSLRTAEGVQTISTDEGTPHTHELQTQTTTLSGLHTHILTLGEESWVSLLPGDLIMEVQEQAKQVPALKDFKIAKRDNPMEMDFGLVKQLNGSNFSKILSKAVLRAQLKNLSRLSDGLRIHSLILSKERFTDIGIARRFVMDHGLNVRASEDRDGTFVFQTLSDDKFQEATLQRVRLTEGVEAVVGFLKDEFKTEESLEGKPEDSLTENATQSQNEQETRTESLDSLQDNNPVPDRSDMDNLRQRLKRLSSIYNEKQRDPTTIQTLIFSKSRFTRSEAISWARDHDFKAGKVDTKENTFRIRQRAPGDFKEGSFRTISLTGGVQAVIGRLKEGKKVLKRNEGVPVKAGDLKIGDFVSFTTGTGRNMEFHIGRVLGMSVESEDDDANPTLRIERMEKNLDGEMKATGEVVTRRLQEVHMHEEPSIVAHKLLSVKMPICKQNEEKRLVTGPVLIPESVDLQDEVISADEIEMASHNFMTKLTFQGDPEFLAELGLNTRADRGFMHSEFDRKIAIVENYLAPVNFEMNERKIIKGTWVMTVKVFDDEVWNLIKAGKITGFSIGGRAKLIDETGKSKAIKFTPTHISWDQEVA